MPLLPLKIPPGVVRPGTVYDARGRWYHTQLVRWVDGIMRAWGGWAALEDNDEVHVTAGDPVRGMTAWRDNAGVSNLAFGSYRKLLHYAGGLLSDITPAGLIEGQAGSSLEPGAYGTGTYGGGNYGTGDAAQETLIEATTWALDNFGEDLVGVSSTDGRVYYWQRRGDGPAERLANAPSFCSGVVVTPERFIVALGAGGNGARVAWCDQENPTVWAPTDLNQAGDFPLATNGRLMAGRRGRNETLLWTDTDLWLMRFVGGGLVYAFSRAGTACGAASRASMAVLGGRAVWMGTRGFFAYDGYVRRLPSEVSDYVFSDINQTQMAKVFVDVRGDGEELTWFYPSAGSDENDRYVSLNLGTGEWAIGELERTAGVDRGVFSNPIMADAAGRLWAHETGAAFPVPGEDDLVPNAESGPVEIGDGVVAFVDRLVPDERTLGGLDLSLITSMEPTGPETVVGPFTTAAPTDVRVSGRLMRLRVAQAAPGWRLGSPQVNVVPAGRR